MKQPSSRNGKVNEIRKLDKKLDKRKLDKFRRNKEDY